MDQQDINNESDHQDNNGPEDGDAFENCNGLGNF